MQNLSARGVGLRVLTGQGAQIDTTAAGRLVFGIFAALAEFERGLIRERTLAGLTAARPQRRQDVRAVDTLSGPQPQVERTASEWPLRLPGPRRGGLGSERCEGWMAGGDGERTSAPVAV